MERWVYVVLGCVVVWSVGCDLLGGSAPTKQATFHVGGSEQWLSPGLSGELVVAKSVHDVPPLRRHLAVVVLPKVTTPKGTLMVVDATGLKPGDEAAAWPMDTASFWRMVRQAPNPNALASHVRERATYVVKARIEKEYKQGRRVAKPHKRAARSAIAIMREDRRSGHHHSQATRRTHAAASRSSIVSSTHNEALDTLVRLTNARRAREQRCKVLGKREASIPLKPHRQLIQAAQAHAADLAASHAIGSKGSDGSSPRGRAKAQGFSRQVFEHTSKGPKTPRAVMSAWMDAGRSCRQITDPKALYVGVGVASDDRGVRYWVQVVGR